MIPQSFIQDLLNRVDIVDVVSRYVPLKKAGANYVACCPFHNEKSPSFTVSQSKQFYHCFGCGAHGSAIGFVMEYGGTGFVEAVRELAGNLGIKVPEDAEIPGPRRADLSEYNSRAAKYYREALKTSPLAIEYLKKRGLSGEIAARFGIGYAPGDWRNLSRVFTDYDLPELVEAGLVISGDGKRYDRFRDRIIFPIVSERGIIIGFGGRVLGAGEPKYLNSPETPLFEKGRELYGLYQARRAIHDGKVALVVEGYMDVVALAQHGIDYAVATLGTATTQVHAQKLLRLADRVVFCFDGDNAGRKAAWRALENTLATLSDGKEAAFMFLPQGEDPDSFVRSRGRDEFEQLVAAAQPLSVYLVNELASRVDLKTEEGRAKFLHEAKPHLHEIKAPMLSLMLRRRIAELAGIDLRELDSHFEIKATDRRESPPARRTDRKPPNVVRKLIELLISNPAFASRIDRIELDSDLDLGALGIPRRESAMLPWLLDRLAESPEANSAGIIESFRGTPFEALLSEIQAGLLMLEELKLDAAELEHEFSGALNQLLDSVYRAKIERLLAKSELSEDDRAIYRELHGKRALLQKNEFGSEIKV